MIKVDISKCTGCQMCETACSFYHSGKISRHISRINVVNLYESGIDGPVVCIQCKERYCMDCPENAITIGTLGQVIVSPTLCSLCDKCLKNCPIGAIKSFNDIIYVCDLCGGTPKCVEVCTEGALVFESGQSEVISLKWLKKTSVKQNISERNMNYIKKQGVELRKNWRVRNA